MCILIPSLNGSISINLKLVIIDITIRIYTVLLNVTPLIIFSQKSIQKKTLLASEITMSIIQNVLLLVIVNFILLDFVSSY